MAIMWALNGGEVQKELNKRLLTIFIITAMMMWYPSIMTGVMKFAQNVGLVPVKAALSGCAGDDAGQGRRPPEGLLRKGRKGR